MATTPIVINNLSDLQAIQNNLAGYYVLGANIDASGFNFLPIGSAANPFTGIFDGQGHTISNLTINNVSNTDSGLFGDIGATGTVRNVGLIDESLTSAYADVGGLAGDNFGTISKSYVSGTVTGGAYVGALVGFNGGSIMESYATAAANGINDVGGLVGVNLGVIADSYATGTINEGRSGLGIGGLVGINTTGTITQSYAIGVLGGGGFAVGGLTGAGGGNNVTASYWDTQTSGRSTSGGGTGLTTAELQSGILPAGFDPAIWLDVAGQFPELRWQVSLPTHDQISPYIFDNTVFDQTSDTAPLLPWFDFFSIGATFSTAGDYGAASASYLGPGSPQTLGLIAPTTFDFGSPAFTSFSNLQAAYPFGTYTVTAVGNQTSSTSSVSYQANYFTGVIPFVTNYSSLNGFNPANDFSVHYNSFTPDAHVTTGVTFFTIWNANTHQVVFQDNFQSASSTTALIPANTLSPNTNYTFELDFSDRLIVGSTTQGFDMRTDGSFATGPVAQTNHAPAVDLAHSVITGNINERPGVTGSLALDIANGAIAFTDADLSDRPTASVVHQTASYQDALGHGFQLTDDQVFKLENAFLSVPESGNTINGEIDWGYTITDSTFDFLGVGETIRVTSTVEINDGHGGKVDQDVTVTINGANDLPKAGPDFATIQKGSTITIDASHGVLANDTDTDIHDILHVSAVNGLDFNIGQPVHGNFGTLTLNANGSYSYTANQNLGSAANTGAVDTFTYTVNGGHTGDDATTELSITISPAKAASPQHAPPTSTLAELVNEAKQEITHQENTSGFLNPSHLTDNFHLVADIANAVAAQFGTPQSHYVIDTTAGDVTHGFINVKSELSVPKDYPFLDQCVALVQALDKNVGGTTTWHPSTQVDVNGQIANLAAGSPIATFTNGRYDGDHAAIFLGSGVEKGVAGFFVLDQYNLPPASSGQILSPDGTPLDVFHYEPAEIRFIDVLGVAATHYFLIA